MAPPDSSSSRTLRPTGDFPEPNRARWQREVEKVLRKSGLLTEGVETPSPVETVLATMSYDGIAVHPLYTESPVDGGYPGLVPYVRGSRPEGNVAEGWDVRQLHANPDPAETNKEIQSDLNNGVSSLWLRVGSAGLATRDLAEALAEVRLDLIGVTLEADADYAEAANAFLDLAHERDVHPSALRGNLGADPLGHQARSGQRATFDDVRTLALRCTENYPGLRTIVVDGSPYHEAGGSDAEELGCALAAAVTYLRELDELGTQAACGLLEFRYAAGVDQFSTIAKFRAARRLWERVTRECGVDERQRWQLQHAVTSSAMLTRHDPWVNMLRNTVAAFAAGIGGAQAITVQPFDAAIGLPDTFARRVARNTQSVLIDEAHLAQVIDPAGGSWYVETLTEQLARAAWEWFQRIEAVGGLPTALESGLVAQRIAATWQRRKTAIAHRSDALIGVSEFPDLDEQPLHRAPAPPRSSGGLPTVRYAEDFEQLRDAADNARIRPAVFLATLGPVAAHTTRASFARNLFSAGGLATPEAGATGSAQDVVDAFANTETKVACLCGRDELYGERAGDTARALKDAGATYVLLAGEPSDPPPPDVDGFVFAGVDAVEILRDLHRRLGVPQ